MITGTHGWHADPALLRSYLGGDVDAITGASLEQHVSRCETCRTAVGNLIEPQLLERTWAGIRDAVERPRQPYPLRVARRCGLPERTVVLLASAASLRGSWLLGAFLSLSFAALAAYASGGTALAPFLLVAPLAPVLGVAAAYGPRQDPLEVLIATAPYGRTRLILVRTIAVLVSVLPVTVLLGLAVPGPPWIAAAWLGPALALVPVQLALAALVGPRIAVTVLSFVWAGLVLNSVRPGMPPTWPVELAQQGVYLAVAAVACIVIAIRVGSNQQPGVPL